MKGPYRPKPPIPQPLLTPVPQSPKIRLTRQADQSGASLLRGAVLCTRVGHPLARGLVRIKIISDDT